MESRPVYEADREVIEACQARGVEVTVRQLERWRPFLPAREIEHVKGRRGSRAANAPGYVEQVIVIAEAVRAGFPLRQVPLVLFARGLPVEVEVLRTAYLDLLTRVTREISKVTKGSGSGSDELGGDQADRLAIRMAARPGGGRTFQQWEKRARQLKRSGQVPDASSARSLLASALSAALTGPVTGVPASTEGIGEALAVFGLDDGQDPGQVAEHLAAITFTAIGEATLTATWEQWVTARADLSTIRRLAQTRRQVELRLLPIEHRLEGLADLPVDEPVSQAALIAGLLVVANKQWRENLYSELARWEALDRLVSALPERFHRYVGKQELPDEVVQELAPIVVKWVEQYPAEAKILNLRLSLFPWPRTSHRVFSSPMPLARRARQRCRS
jgi:hypothetical protein